MAKHEEGEKCPDPGCEGSLQFSRVGDCSCHISPPCDSCTESPLKCDECGWSTDEPPAVE